MPDAARVYRHAPKTGASGEVIPVPVLVLFCVYVLAWFLQFSVRVEALEALRFELVLGSVLAVLAALTIIRHPPRIGASGKAILTAALILLALISVQLLFAPDFAMAWDTYIERVIKFAFMAVFIVAFVRTERDLKWFLGAFLLACAYICQESVEGALTGSMVWENQGVPRLHGSTSMFRHPNSLGGLATGVLPFCYFLFFASRNRWLRVTLIAIAAMALLVIMYSGSRTAYIGVFVLLVYFLAKSRLPFGRMVAVGAAAVVIVLLAVPDIYKARFATIATGEEIEGNSMGARKQIMIDSVEIFSRYPFGVGLDGFSPKRLELFGRKQDTHNLYLQVATQHGIQGLLAFIVLVILLWRGLTRLIRSFGAESATGAGAHGRVGGRMPRAGPADSHPQDAASPFLMAVALAVQGYLLARLVLGMFGHDLYEIYWWIVLGLTLTLMSIAAGSERRPTRTSGARSRQRSPGFMSHSPRGRGLGG